MNFGYLASKYIAGSQYIVHDRTYDGLEWLGPGEKPSIELFEAFQREEDRQNSVAQSVISKRDNYMQERQHQTRVQALYDSLSWEEQFKLEEDKIRAEIFDLRMKAIEEQERAKTVHFLGESWEEIAKAQEKVNLEAQTYLNDTDWYVKRFQETGKPVPEEILQKREEARKRINHGKVVFANWAYLRQKEMPSREEIKAALRAGGEELKRIRDACESAALKYPKPKRSVRI